MKTAKVGDLIEWSFDKDYADDRLAGKTFQAEVSVIDRAYSCYWVNASYGQDMIQFDKCKIID